MYSRTLEPAKELGRLGVYLFVAVWRRRALEQFPELRERLTRAHEIESVYELWFELLPIVRDAHDRNERDLLRRVYGYAHWAARHPSKELWNPVGVAFLEHLLDGASDSRMAEVLEWLADDLIADAWELWELQHVELGKVERLLREQKRQPPKLSEHR